MQANPVSFREITTLRVGGSIASLERLETLDECVSLVQELDSNGTPLLILGGGSNVLARDEPYKGVVVIPLCKSITFEAEGESVRVTADAGVVWDDLVSLTVEKELWGLENLSSIPGNVGAAPMQNIGAYGVDVSNTIEWVEVYDRLEKKVRTLTKNDLNFGYRTSLLKKNRERYLILRVSFILSKKAQPNISYKDLVNTFGEGSKPPLGDIRDAVIHVRKGKFPDLQEYGTAGSFFLNPVLGEEDFKKFLAQYPDAPHYSEKKCVKISLAWILDFVIHAKGMRVGGAHVWDKQPLVIATDVNATGEDIRTLVQQLQEKVLKETKIHITPEVYVM